LNRCGPANRTVRRNVLAAVVASCLIIPLSASAAHAESKGTTSQSQTPSKSKRLFSKFKPRSKSGGTDRFAFLLHFDTSGVPINTTPDEALKLASSRYLHPNDQLFLANPLPAPFSSRSRGSATSPLGVIITRNADRTITVTGRTGPSVKVDPADPEQWTQAKQQTGLDGFKKVATTRNHQWGMHQLLGRPGEGSMSFVREILRHAPHGWTYIHWQDGATPQQRSAVTFTKWSYNGRTTVEVQSPDRVERITDFDNSSQWSKLSNRFPGLRTNGHVTDNNAPAFRFRDPQQVTTSFATFLLTRTGLLRYGPAYLKRGDSDRAAVRISQDSANNQLLVSTAKDGKWSAPRNASTADAKALLRRQLRKVQLADPTLVTAATRDKAPRPEKARGAQR